MANDDCILGISPRDDCPGIRHASETGDQQRNEAASSSSWAAGWLSLPENFFRRPRYRARNEVGRDWRMALSGATAIRDMQRFDINLQVVAHRILMFME